ncbi:hypothetical protein [Streptomyces sp. A0592]|uniref:hypothetical protein n=1 Tax=Streptomyces sp. A0592 TaxID=2563099 RepID=UPI00109E399E|nr:hypothetical protein [Streptomyces sp. A0592]THA86192.1 hypothetical protein E6U81_04125 [Streptomyces sp. A0592]
MNEVIGPNVGAGDADAARRKRVRRSAAWGGVAGAAGVVPVAINATEFWPWWLNLVFCLFVGGAGAFTGAVTGRREGRKSEVRRDTLEAGERQLGQYRVRIVPEGAQAPAPFKEDDYTSYSLTTTTHRLQLWEFGYVPQWSHPWRDLHLALEDHVVVITGPQGLLGRFILGRNVVPNELVLVADRLRARAPRHSAAPESGEY